jgi:hypothetical protein
MAIQKTVFGRKGSKWRSCVEEPKEEPTVAAYDNAVLIGSNWYMSIYWSEPFSSGGAGWSTSLVVSDVL